MVRALSGAADEIGFLFGVVDKMRDQGLTFKAECGTSSGAIVQLVNMCGDWKKATDLILSFTLEKHIFGYNPFSLRGVLIALSNIFKSSSSLWNYNKLEQTLKSVCTEEAFYSYKGCPIYIGTCDLEGRISYTDITKKSYESAIKIVIESCSIPIITKIEDNMDGGVSEHIGSYFLVEKYKENILSVFARTEDFTETIPKKVLRKISWVLKKFFYNVSKADEEKTTLLCNKYNLSHHRVYMYEDVIEGMFTIKKEDNEKLYSLGYNYISK